MLTLRDYQNTVISDVRRAFAEGHRRILTVLPCGGGKTVIFAQIASLAQQKQSRVLFLVHRRELVDQTVATFQRFNIPPVTITTVQSFVRHLDSTPYNLIILDEAHHSTSSTWQKIINHYPNACIVGLTATPCRLDGAPLGNIYTKLIVGADAEQLTAAGYLSEYKYYAPSLADLSNLRQRGADYDQQHVSEILSRPKIYGKIIETYQSIAPNLKTIAYAPTIPFSQQLAEQFNVAGVSAMHFDAETPANVRKSLISSFRSGAIQVLCNVDLISEGFDVPDCQCAILLRPTQSTALYIQQACRPLRPSPDKPYATIIDHVANYARHGFPTDTHTWSLETTVKPRNNTNPDGSFTVRVCEQCFRTFKTAQVCPYCGYVYKPTETEIQQINTVRLSEITKQQKLAAELKLQRFRCYIADKVKNYKSYRQCSNKAELSEFCRINNLSIKSFRYYAFQLGFFGGKRG